MAINAMEQGERKKMFLYKASASSFEFASHLGNQFEIYWLKFFCTFKR